MPAMIEPMTPKSDYSCCIIGAGPAGLMAAERLAQAGCRVALYDRMPTPGRKFLMAGRGIGRASCRERV